MYEFAIDVKICDSGEIKVITPEKLCEDAKIDIESAVEETVSRIITDYEPVFNEDGGWHNKSITVLKNLFKE